MVHVRLNERESNPNPHCNFIAAFDEDARQYIRALAAQVRPIMKAHGFVVNSLEEYEYNLVFAGRNWNHGETVELVLRRPNGSFFPTSWLMSVFCHELAHIKHMNHGPAFQALWKRLRAEVRALQDKGYYGDGYWSAGTRLIDSATVTGDGITDEDLPEYMCGGAQSRTRPKRKRRVRQKKLGEPIASNKTGRQTAKKRKAGGRVTSQVAFTGEGSLLVQPEDLDLNGKGIGFRKQAGSKRAREERALAVERRIQALQGGPQQASTPDNRLPPDSEDESSDDEVEIVSETDAERRQTLHNSEGSDDLLTLSGTAWRELEDAFVFKRENVKISSDDSEMIDISSDDDDDLPVASGSTFVMPPPKKKPIARSKNSSPKDRKKGTTDIGLGKMVQSEVSLRKKESLGMAPVKTGRVIGGTVRKTAEEPEWACTVCTLRNKQRFLACSACSTPRASTA
ncbi:WLM domain-containing protein [Mycena alexandri]|uniref:WLM domain-containing protein n=1 Tax=Mycena alexandri TaxID=1745969 RepID=A0AAD6SY78_9AGAR|nr:WLM domain-containing protein [Mycena alexandri]